MGRSFAASGAWTARDLGLPALEPAHFGVSFTARGPVRTWYDLPARPSLRARQWDGHGGQRGKIFDESVGAPRPPARTARVRSATAASARARLHPRKTPRRAARA